MNNSKDHPFRSRLLKVGQAVLLIINIVIFLLPTPPVEANFFDTIKDIYHLPKNVENLQKQYEEAKKSYEETKDQVEQQKQQLVDQQNQLLESARQARETEERLNQQNQELLEHNNELQARLLVMEETVSTKDKWIKRIKVIGITLVSLVLLYFLIGRLFRVFIWRRNSRKAH